MHNYGAMPLNHIRTESGSDRVVFARFNHELQSGDLPGWLSFSLQVESRVWDPVATALGSDMVEWSVYRNSDGVHF